MNLNDIDIFRRLDPADMLGEINALPDQLESAWSLGQDLPLPRWSGLRRVLIAGLGGSAIGADLLAAYLAPSCPLPVFVHRDYDLPAWASGEDTLVIAASHSGNTEETLSAARAAVEQGCRWLAVTTGGKLESLANENGAPVWKFEHAGQPRAAVGYSFGLLLAVLARLGLVDDPGRELASAVGAMREQQKELAAGTPDIHNPAKRLAGQCMERIPVVLGAGLLAPVARRWKGQFSEVAKAWAQFEFLPEANHNTLAGLINPEVQLGDLMVFFLQAPADHARNRLRSELTRKIFMLQGIRTDFVNARGDTPLAQQWTLLHIGDYTAYYLAMGYQVDPTPVEILDYLKNELKTVDG